MNIFDNILVKKPKRSLFNMSHEVKLTGNMGYLYPIFCQEVVPGDTFRISSEVLCRFSPLIAPIMHRVNLKINYFFVPNRLIWDDWETFITGGPDGKSFPVVPYIEVSADNYLTSLHPGTLPDYLGFPSVPSDFELQEGDPESQKLNALPFRAYNLIWNEWFRNQNLQVERPIGHGSGKDTDTKLWTTVAKRCWEKDYFTSALPFVQRGNDVLLPIDDGVVEISGSGNATCLVDTLVADREDHHNETGMKIHSSGGSQMFVAADDTADLANDDVVTMKGHTPRQNIADGLEAELVSVTATINDLRVAYRLQRWLENNARAGARYIEQILAHFGVKTPDARLQRSEYLGGYTAPVVISEVLQNSQSDETPQGNMAGHAMVVDKSHRVKRYFPEHGWIIGLLSVIPRTCYQDGMPRQFMRKNRYDYFFPEFANLGEQDIQKSEVLFDFHRVDGNAGVFGYQQRYAEMRYIPSTVHGDFKSNLSYWHLGRMFSSVPALNSSFVQCSPDNRVFNVLDETEHHLWIEVYNNVRAVRPLPKFAIPSW